MSAATAAFPTPRLSPLVGIHRWQRTAAVAVVVLAVATRLPHVLTSGVPAGDGGLFYLMTQALASSWHGAFGSSPGLAGVPVPVGLVEGGELAQWHRADYVFVYSGCRCPRALEGLEPLLPGALYVPTVTDEAPALPQ